MSGVQRELIEVADDVWVGTSSKFSTTSTVIVNGTDAILVDPAWLPGELTSLARELDRRRLRVTAGFSTHAHHDHLLWHPAFGDAPRWASQRTVELASEHRADLLSQLEGWPWPDVFAKLSAIEGAPLTETASLTETAGLSERAQVVVHDGHAPGHSALWLPEREVLLAGDMLSDIELPLPFWPDDVAAYLSGLEALEPYVRKAQVVIPGHGSPGNDPVGRLAADRRYMEETIAGREVEDPRLDNPDMQTHHAHLSALVKPPFRSGS